MANKIIALRIFIGALCMLLASSLSEAAENQCAALSPARRTKLTEYVRKSYQLPESVKIELAEVYAVSASCHRKLVFRSIDKTKKAFSAELFLSPDLRYLSKDLLDSTVDPLKERQRKEQELLAEFSNGRFAVSGTKNAPVTLTVFSDFQCPFCAKMANMLRSDVLPISDGKVKIIFRHFPLSNHNWAKIAANMTICAQEQSDEFFWKLHDFIFEHQRQITAETAEKIILFEASRLAKLDQVKFKACVTSGRSAEIVEKDVALANKYGVSGTPTLYMNERQMNNIVAPEQLLSLIQNQLQTQSTIKEIAQK